MGRLEHPLKLAALLLAGVSLTWTEVSADLSASASAAGQKYTLGQVGKGDVNHRRFPMQPTSIRPSL